MLLGKGNENKACKSVNVPLQTTGRWRVQIGVRRQRFLRRMLRSIAKAPRPIYRNRGQHQQCEGAPLQAAEGCATCKLDSKP